MTETTSDEPERQGQPFKDESPSQGVDAGPAQPSSEQAGEDATQLPDEEAAETVPDAKPVDDPNLPEEGDDPDQFEEEPIDEKDLDTSDESSEQLEDPNDLSDVDKEFDDEDDG